MRTTVTQLFTLEHPDTGEESHFWVDIEVTHDKEVHTLPNGDPGTPEFTHTNIIGWGLCQDDTKPSWVKPYQIDEIVDNLDLSNIIDDEQDFQEELYDKYD